MTEDRAPYTVQKPEPPYVLLDGVFVQPHKVDPAKHRFLGIWRPPINPFLGATTAYICVCGATLNYAQQTDQHYRNGCFDTPQYVSISP